MNKHVEESEILAFVIQHSNGLVDFVKNEK